MIYTNKALPSTTWMNEEEGEIGSDFNSRKCWRRGKYESDTISLNHRIKSYGQKN